MSKLGYLKGFGIILHNGTTEQVPIQIIDDRGGTLKVRDSNFEYEVLSPWAKADPKTLSGLSPRLTDLHGKTVGLFSLWKVAARPTLMVVEEKLKQRYSNIRTSWAFERKGDEKASIDYLGPDDLNDPESIALQNWAKGVDAVVCGVGD